MPISKRQKLKRSSSDLKNAKRSKNSLSKSKRDSNESFAEFSEEDSLSDMDFTALETGTSEEEFWARKLGITGDNSSAAMQRLADEYSKDGLGDDFLELFDFMDQVREEAKSTKTAKDSGSLDLEPQKYIPPHRREGVTSSDGTVSAKTKQTSSLLGLLNRVSEGNLDSISLEIITLILQNKINPVDFAKAIVATSCDNPNITVTLQGTFAAIASAVAVETSPSNRFSGCLLAQLVSKIKESIAFQTDFSRIVANLIRFAASLFSMGLFSVDVVQSLLSYIVSLPDGTSNERKLEWILVCLRFAGRVLRDHHKARLADILENVLDKLPSVEGGPLVVEFGLKELRSMKEGKSGFRAVDHLQSVCEWLAVRGVSGKAALRGSSDGGSTLNGWKVPRQVEAVQLVLPTVNVFSSDFSFPTEWTVNNSLISIEDGTITALSGKSDKESCSLEELASMNRMTTEVKRNAFIAIMGSVDSKHAVLRLNQFSLMEPKNVPSIVAVVCHCALQETSVNNFYISLLESLCGNALEKKLSRKFSVSFKIEFSKLISSGKLNATEIGVLSNIIAAYISLSGGKVTMDDILRSSYRKQQVSGSDNEDS